MALKTDPTHVHLRPKPRPTAEEPDAVARVRGPKGALVPPAGLRVPYPLETFWVRRFREGCVVSEDVELGENGAIVPVAETKSKAKTTKG